MEIRGLNVSYTGGVDYDQLPGEAIFINSNLISTEPASVKEKDSADWTVVGGVGLSRSLGEKFGQPLFLVVGI